MESVTQAMSQEEKSKSEDLAFKWLKGR